MNEKKFCISVRLNEKEKARLEKNSASCGLSQADYLKQLLLGNDPKPNAPMEFWQAMESLYAIHDKLKQYSDVYPEFKEYFTEIESLVLTLQEAA